MGHNGRLLVRLHVGHTSSLIEPGHPAGHTHRWTVFVRSVENEDFKDKSFIEKVCFHLHPDFPNPKRLVKAPPYQVTETGYAGFSIPLEIWLAGKKYKVNYDLNLTMEPSARYQTPTTISVSDYTPEFYSIAKRYGAERQKRSREADGGGGLGALLGAPPSSVSPPPEKIRKKERSADVSARSSPAPFMIDRLKIRLDERDKDLKKAESSISPPARGEKRREEAGVGDGLPPPPPKEKKKKENKMLDFVLDRSSASSARPSPSASPAVTVDKLKKEERRKDVSASASPSTSAAVERLRKEEKERKREKASSASSPSVEKERKKDKNGVTPSPPEKERRKEKDADRLQGVSPTTDKQKEKERKEKREKDADRLQGVSPPTDKQKEKERKEKREKDGDRLTAAVSGEKKEKVKEKEKEREKGREKEKVELPAFEGSPMKREKERKKDKQKDRDRPPKDAAAPLRPPSATERGGGEREKEKEKEREMKRPMPAITPPPVLTRQECIPSSSCRSTSPPTLVPVNNGRTPASFSSYGGGSATSSQQLAPVSSLPSLLSLSTLPSFSSSTSSLQPAASSSNGMLQQPSPSGSLGGRETPSEKASRSSISPALRNEETASSGGSSASSHSSERREQKRIPKLAPSKGEREAMSAPLISIDASTVRRKMESLTDPEKVFEVALLLLDLDDTSHVSIGKGGAPPSLSYDLAGIDQKDLLRLDAVLNGS